MRKISFIILLSLLLLASEMHGMPQFLTKLNGKLGRSISGMLMAGMLVCLPFTGCEYGPSRQVINVLGEKEEDEQDIKVVVDGKHWFGYQSGSVGYLRAEIVDDNGVVVFRQVLTGFVGEAISDHPHLGAQVSVDHDNYRWFGTVVAVFDNDFGRNDKNDFYQIAVSNWLYLGEGDSIAPSYVPRYILAYPRGGVDPQGFVWVEETDDAQQ